MQSSVALDFSSKETPQTYDITLRWKALSRCVNDSFLLDKASLSYRSENVTVTLLPSSCADCIVFNFEAMIVFLSRSPSIDEDFLKQFETQAACAQLPFVLLFNHDYDFDKCKAENEDLTEEEQEIMTENVKNVVQELAKCFGIEFKTRVQSWVNDGFKQIKEGVTSVTETVQSYIPEPVVNGWNWIRSWAI